MSSIGLKNRILKLKHRSALAIALVLAATGGPAAGQGAPPLPFDTPAPKTIGVVLRPITSDPDAGIVRAYAERNHEKIRARFGSAAADYNIETAFVGRSKIAPSSEPQILFLLTGPEDCWQGECVGFAITKTAEDWVELIDLAGFVEGDFGVVKLATAPIQARLLNPRTHEHDIPAIVEPENEGRRTLVWGEGGYYWTGVKWDAYCWQRCD
jgi:hypothetical protein